MLHEKLLYMLHEIAPNTSTSYREDKSYSYKRPCHGQDSSEKPKIGERERERQSYIHIQMICCKELAHVGTEAKMSLDLQFSCLMWCQFQFKVQVQGPCPSLETGRQREQILPYSAFFILFQSPVDWMRLNHVGKGDFLHSFYQFKC